MYKKYFKYKVFIGILSILIPLYFGVIIYEVQRLDSINKKKIEYLEKVQNDIKGIKVLIQGERVEKTTLLEEDLRKIG